MASYVIAIRSTSLKVQFSVLDQKFMVLVLCSLIFCPHCICSKSVEIILKLLSQKFCILKKATTEAVVVISKNLLPYF